MKLSPNQEASLAALKAATVARGVEAVTKAVWKKHCADGVSVHAAAMIKAGAVAALKVVVSTNDKIVELYKPA